MPRSTGALSCLVLVGLAWGPSAAGQQTSYTEVTHILPPEVEVGLEFG